MLLYRSFYEGYKKVHHLACKFVGEWNPCATRLSSDSQGDALRGNEKLDFSLESVFIVEKMRRYIDSF